MQEELVYKLLKTITLAPAAQQRELAHHLGVSLGKINYCLRALIDKGWVKIENFRRSDAKRKYLYTLTPLGLAEKAQVTLRFLKRKTADFEALQHELVTLEQEARELGLCGQDPHDRPDGAGTADETLSLQSNELG